MMQTIATTFMAVAVSLCFFAVFVILLVFLYSVFCETLSLNPRHPVRSWKESQ